MRTTALPSFCARGLPLRAAPLLFLMLTAHCRHGSTADDPASQSLQPSEAQDSPAPPPAERADAMPSAAQKPCDLLDDSKFESEAQHPCGPPIDGQPAPSCPSVIEFTKDEYHWRVTDMMFTGRYQCSETTVRSIDTDDLKGTLSADGQQLTINGERYRRVRD